MARTRWLGPLDPIFDDTHRSGAIAVGNTPGVEYDYDYVLLHVIGGAIWYCAFDTTGPVSWPSLATVAAGDYRNENSHGLIWFDAWYSESGNAPVTYWDAVEVMGSIWYSTLDTTTAVTWPDLATVISGDYRNENSHGLYWFNAWYAESGYAPVDYADTIDITGPIWYSALNELVTGVGIPVGGTVTVSGGYRYHTFNSSDQFWTMSTSPLAVELVAHGGGGSGGRGTTNQCGGGGGAGEVETYSGNITDGALITIGAGGTNPGSGAQGNDGGTTTVGSLVTALGGSGGGAPTISSGAGKTGSGSGGGGAAASGVSGAGGAGSTGGNNGGAGGGSATAAQQRAGGGGGAGGAGTTGVANSTTGTGGSGYTWLDGVTRGGGGGGATGAGTAFGGSGGGGNGTTGGGTAGAVNTGSGGGGASNTSSAGAGGSGVVIIRYPWP